MRTIKMISGDRTSHNNERIVDIVIILILLLSGLKLTYGLSDVLDLMMSDETGYIKSGVNIIKNGFPNPEWSPLYAIWYYILSFIAKDNINLYYLNYKLLTIIIPILIYIVLRVYQVHISIAFVSAFLFLISRANLPALPKASHFALVIVLTTFILAGLTQSSIKYCAIVAFGIIFASYARPELFLSFLALLIAYSFLFIKYRQAIVIKHELFSVIISSCAILATILIFGLPISGDSNRMWFNFGWNFSYNYHYWHDIIKIDPYENWSSILATTFGDARSISQAFINNPWAFSKHILTNIYFYILNMFSIIFIHYNLILPPANKLYSIIEGISLFLVIITFVILNKNNLLNSYLNNKFIRYKLLIVLLSVVIVAPLFLSTILMAPVPRLLTLQYGIILIACIALFSNGTFPIDPTLRIKHLIIFAIIILAITPYVCNNWYFTNKYNINKLDSVNTIKFLRSMEIRSQVNLLNATGDYHVYLNNNFKTISNWDKKENFYNFLNKYNINAIVIEENLLESQFFMHDQEWLDFCKRFKDFGFKEIKIPNTDTTLLIKENITK